MKNEEKNKKCIYDENIDNNKNTNESLIQLVHILKQLRGEEGCPWDKVQTHESLKPCLIEESYEVIDAIDKKDMQSLEEELGDVLLQVVFHANIAEEQGCFDVDDVINTVSKKMLYRHPHVFGDVEAGDVSQAINTWEEMKRSEKGEKSYTDKMRDIPAGLPALMKSYKVQKKAAEVGFDWEHVESAFEKIREETEELIEIYQQEDKAKIEEELGDLLFAVVNAARFLKVDPEIALNTTITKFINRFSYIEKMAKSQSKRIEDMSLEEMDAFWEESKKYF